MSSLLFDAVHNRQLTEIQNFFEKGVNVNIQNDEGKTLLSYAAQIGEKDIVQLLIAKGASVNTQDNKGESPLINASSYGHIDIVKLLLEKGANVNAQDNMGASVLIHACCCGHLEIVKLLLDNGASINLKSNLGQSPLYMASFNGHSNIVQELLKRGADIIYKSNVSEAPPLDIIFSLKRTHWKQISQLIIEKEPLALFYSKERLLQAFIRNITAVKYPNDLILNENANNRSLTILHGGFLPYSWRKIGKLTFTFCKEFSDLISLERAETIINAVQFASTQMDISSEDLFKRWEKSLPVLIDSGFAGNAVDAGHSSSVLLWNHSLIFCDRALCDRGLHIVFKEELINVDLIKQIREKYLTKEEYREFFLNKLPKFLHKEYSGYNFVLGLQTTPNCSWANAEGNVLSCFIQHALIEWAEINDFNEEKVIEIMEKQFKVFEAWKLFVQIHTIQKYLEKRIKQSQELLNFELLSTAIEKCKPPLDADPRLINKYELVQDLYEKYSKKFTREPLFHRHA